MEVSRTAGRGAAVIVEDAAQHRATPNGADAHRLFWRNGALLLKTLMGAGHIVVVDIGLQHPAQMSLVQNQEMIQAFFPYGSHPTFSIRVDIGCPKGGANDLDAF